MKYFYFRCTRCNRCFKCDIMCGICPDRNGMIFCGECEPYFECKTYKISEKEYVVAKLTE